MATKKKGQYKLDPRNARTHSDRNKEAVQKSLAELGAGRSIVVDKDGVVIGGNAVYEKALELGLETRIVHTTGDRLVVVMRDDLSTDDPRRKALALADNQIATLAEWDETLLEEIQLEIEDIPLDVMGFDLPDEPIEEPTDPGELIDRAAELQRKWKVKRGQIWEIPGKAGTHRVMCGDSTDEGAARLLMGDAKALLFATDPPYGCKAGSIGYTAQRDDIEAITKDDLEGKEMQAFLENVFRVWIPYLEKNCAWYLWHPMLTQGYFAAAAAAAAADLIIHRQIIWRKEQFIFGRGDYHWRHELCFYGWRQGNRPAFYGEHNQDTVWDVAWGEKRGVIGHPTTKPLELFAIPLRNHTQCGDLCADPFLGSGTTVVAAEQEGRVCFGMEIEPKYVAVTLERLSALGLKPVKCDD